jgi:hypothetical protein
MCNPLPVDTPALRSPTLRYSGSPLPNLSMHHIFNSLTLAHPVPMTHPFTTSKATSERLCAQLGARRPCASHGLTAANARSSQRLPRQCSHPRLAPFVAPYFFPLHTPPSPSPFCDPFFPSCISYFTDWGRGGRYTAKRYGRLTL